MVMGQDGVSSDESDVEDGKPVLKAKKLKWRINIDDQLTLADNAKKLRPDLFVKAGAPAITRTRGEDASSRVSCPKMFALAALEPAYLSSLMPSRVRQWNLRETDWKPKSTTETGAGTILEM